MKLAHAIREIFYAIPDKWIAVFVFVLLLGFYHFHPLQFVESMINTILGALVMGLTIGFKRLENAPYKTVKEQEQVTSTVETTVGEKAEEAQQE